jgi:DNA-binding MarR family transcriptional regulator
MSSNMPHSFGDPSLIAIESSDRDAHAKLLGPILDADASSRSDGALDGGRAEAAKWLYDQRRRREQFLPPELFGEPAWDILLILYWAQHSQRRLSVSAVCASAGAPNTTALRHIEHLCRSAYIVRKAHPTDRRISWLSLSNDADQRIGQYLDRLLKLPPESQAVMGTF